MRKYISLNRLIRQFDGSKVQVLNGKYGAYITDGEKNGKIPKDRDPKTLSLEECEAILLAAPFRPQRGRFGRKVAAKKAPAKKAATTGADGAAPKKAAAKKATKKVAKKAAAKKVAKKATKKVPAKKAAKPAASVRSSARA